MGITGGKVTELTEEEEKRLREEFEKLDSNHDGYLQKGEIFRGLKKAFPKLNKMRLKMMVDQIFEEYDTNRDGKLSWQEYLRYKK